MASDGRHWRICGRRSTGNHLREIEPDLIGIKTRPVFGIGQQSLLIKTANGNVLWDPISYLDGKTIEAVHRFGGIKVISASHPHFYASMVEWSLAFAHAPIVLPEADQRWIMRPCDSIRFFKDQIELLPQIEVFRCGGHFPGSSVLVWQSGANGKGGASGRRYHHGGHGSKVGKFHVQLPESDPPVGAKSSHDSRHAEQDAV